MTHWWNTPLTTHLGTSGAIIEQLSVVAQLALCLQAPA